MEEGGREEGRGEGEREERREEEREERKEGERRGLIPIRAECQNESIMTHQCLDTLETGTGVPNLS